MKNLFIFRRSRVRYCNKILRQFVTNSIETRLKSWRYIFISDARYFVEFRIENIIHLNVQLPLSVFDLFFSEGCLPARTKTQGTR